MRFAEHVERSPPAERLTSPTGRRHLTRFDHGPRMRSTAPRGATTRHRARPPSGGQVTTRPAGNRRTSRRRTPHGSRSAGCSRVRVPRSGPSPGRRRRTVRADAHRRPDLPDRPVHPTRTAWRAELEDRGFESLWVTEHTHIPTSRRTPWPGGPRAARGVPPHARPVRRPDGGGDGHRAAQARHRHLARRPARPDRARQDGRLARPPLRTGGCCSASASAGTRTRWSTTASTRSGAAPWPASTSSRCASCGRRTRPRSTASTSASRRRGAGPSRSADPHPPILMGGAGGPVTFRHVVEYCDGWMPIHGRREHRRQARRAARRPPTRPGGTWPRSSSACSAARPTARSSTTTPSSASPAACSACPPTGEDDALRALDRYADVVADVRPRLSACAVLGIDLAWGQGRPGVPPTRPGSSPSSPTARSSTPGGPAASTRRRRGWRAGRPPTRSRWSTPRSSCATPTGMRECEKEIGRRYGRWKVSANASNLGLPGVLAGVVLAGAAGRRRVARRRRPRRAARGRAVRCTSASRTSTLVGVPAARLRPRAPGLQAQAAPPHAGRVPGAAGRQRRRDRPAGRRASTTRRSTCARTR